MESNFTYKASSSTDEELIERVDNRQKYLPETIEASLAELQYRKHEFSDEELKVIHEDIQARRENVMLVSSRLGLFSNEYQNAIVEDPDAPLMYSRRVLYVFTVLMGALFGSIMLAINVSKTEKKNAVWLVLLFGIAFTALQVFFVTKANPGSQTSYQIIGGLIAAMVIDYFFWKEYIGYSTFYRARPVWIPLIIAVVLFALIISASIYGGK